MHATFDLSEIEETMLQQARKKPETELETTLHSLSDVCCPHTTVLISPVHNPVYSPEFTIRTISGGVNRTCQEFWKLLVFSTTTMSTTGD